MLPVIDAGKPNNALKRDSRCGNFAKTMSLKTTSRPTHLPWLYSQFATFNRERREPHVVEFKNLAVLIVGPMGHSMTFLRGVLRSHGVTRITTASKVEKALLWLQKELFQIVFCDEKVDVVTFLRMLRRDLETSDITVPVILVSAGVNREQIQGARDAGVNDVIAKPVSANTVEQKLRSLILTPRPFVAARSFVGPDRRRERDTSHTGDGASPSKERRGGTAEASVFVLPPKKLPKIL
jgi:two-component system, chemotaxis family, chemotaxis protein CheY